ncbi:MAG TPA: hypothetical protein VF498_06530 [Anaerolineales bacterium]
MQNHTQMETHVKVVGWLYIVLGGLGILAAALVFLIVFGSGLISGDRTAIGVTFIVAAAVAVMLLVLSVPGVIAGFGLLSFKPWARILALILGILNLPGFPLGTLLGIYTLYALVDEEGARLFKSAQ